MNGGLVIEDMTSLVMNLAIIYCAAAQQQSGASASRLLDQERAWLKAILNQIDDLLSKDASVTRLEVQRHSVPGFPSLS